MKRILGQGHIRKLDTASDDETVNHLGKRDTVIAFEVKAPEFLVQFFLANGKVEIKQDLRDEYYVPTNFVREDGTKLNAKEGTELNTKFLNYYRFLSNFHSKLSKQGILLEQLAYLLPFGIFETFNWVISVEGIEQFLSENLEDSSPERKEVSQALLAYFKELFPHTSSKFLQEFSRRKQS